MKSKLVNYAVGMIFMVVYLFFMLLYLYPYWPIDFMGWTILVLIGIPVNLFFEWISEKVFSKETGGKISDSKFSGMRIATATLIALAVTGAFGVIWFYFGSLIRPHFR